MIDVIPPCTKLAMIDMIMHSFNGMYFLEFVRE